MNEITTTILTIAITGITAFILGIIISRYNNNKEIEMYLEDNLPSQNNLIRQKVLEKLIREQYTIKYLTILNTLLTIVLITIIIIDKLFNKIF